MVQNSMVQFIFLDTSCRDHGNFWSCYCLLPSQVLSLLGQRNDTESQCIETKRRENEFASKLFINDIMPYFKSASANSSDLNLVLELYSTARWLRPRLEDVFFDHMAVADDFHRDSKGWQYDLSQNCTTVYRFPC